MRNIISQYPINPIAPKIGKIIPLGLIPVKMMSPAQYPPRIPPQKVEKPQVPMENKKAKNVNKLTIQIIAVRIKNKDCEFIVIYAQKQPRTEYNRGPAPKFNYTISAKTARVMLLEIEPKITTRNIDIGLEHCSSCGSKNNT